MTVPVVIWIAFIFAFGCCIGSFLNVVIYRLPKDQSLISPPSACPGCGKRIRFYDNIPLFSWLILGGKCRDCKIKISPRYFIIEFLTGLVFVSVFVLYFVVGVRHFSINGTFGLMAFVKGGWLLYLVLILLLSGLIAASAIDLELWVIPISICWLITAIGMAGASLGVFVIDPVDIGRYYLFPRASATTGALSLGAAVGTLISCILLATGLIKRSYEIEESSDASAGEVETQINHRLEVFKEIVFLLPIIICSFAVYRICKDFEPIGNWWLDFSQKPLVSGFLGSLWGYFVGCAVVWITRILGTLGFGKEAMGLGDVHLMGAAGAVLGPVFVVVAFFIAPFFGLCWAGFQMFFKKIHQIPYGPFLSLGILSVIILHDWIFDYLIGAFYH